MSFHERHVPGDDSGGTVPPQRAVGAIAEYPSGSPVVAGVGDYDVAVVRIDSNSVWRRDAAFAAIADERLPQLISAGGEPYGTVGDNGLPFVVVGGTYII